MILKIKPWNDGEPALFGWAYFEVNNFSVRQISHKEVSAEGAANPVFIYTASRELPNFAGRENVNMIYGESSGCESKIIFCEPQQCFVLNGEGQTIDRI